MTQRKVQKPAKQGSVSPKAAKEAVKAVTEARTYAIGDVSTESNTTVAPNAKTSTKASQKATAPKPTIASLSSEVDSLKARLENSKKYAEELESKLIFASGKIKNLELDLLDLEEETYWEYTKRKAYAFFTFGV